MNFTGRGKKVAVTKNLLYIYILRIFEPQFKAVSYQSEAQTVLPRRVCLQIIKKSLKQRWKTS